ncbi:hypothetical protein [Stenotrophomonas geniculata]|uniref:hypothetical protein n=1 Tax=Stenotrophomonas geniculata TaxID=86188 RepID=UPI002E79E6D4|nr:hypothetical protein [Stenotrophomonas geniculata]
MSSTSSRYDQELVDLQRRIEHASSQLVSRAKLFGSANTFYNHSKHVFEVHTMLGRREILLGQGSDIDQALAAAMEVLLPEVARRALAASRQTTPHPIADARAPTANTKTIGVSAPVTLWSAVKDFGGEKSQSLSARVLLRRGMDLFDQGLRTSRTSTVNERLDEALIAFEGRCKQVMARVDPSLYCELLVAAHENGKTLSAFSAGCLAMALQSRLP